MNEGFGELWPWMSINRNNFDFSLKCINNFSIAKMEGLN